METETKRSPIPRLILMTLVCWVMGWLVIQHPEWFQPSWVYTFGVWGFGFGVGTLITAIILKW